YAPASPPSRRRPIVMRSMLHDRSLHRRELALDPLVIGSPFRVELLRHRIRKNVLYVRLDTVKYFQRHGLRSRLAHFHTFRHVGIDRAWKDAEDFHVPLRKVRAQRLSQRERP